jgi:ABC-type transporter Mla maintaining outer membrane lipid asymmetry ATPase subunit MlaF
MLWLRLSVLVAQTEWYPREPPFGLQKRADLARAVTEGADLILLDRWPGGAAA